MTAEQIAEKEQQKILKNREKSRRNMAAKRKRDRLKEIDEENELLGPNEPLFAPKLNICGNAGCRKLTPNRYYCSSCHCIKRSNGSDVPDAWVGC